MLFRSSFISGNTSTAPNVTTPSGVWIRALSNTNNQYMRRFWEQDVEGKNEEEYESFWTSVSGGTYYGLSIEELCANIQSRKNTPSIGGAGNGVVHQGWIASPTGPTTGDLIGTNLGWFQPGSAWAAWLNGFGLQCIAGTKTYSILRDLSEESGDREIYAQQVFDSINC